MDSSSATAYLSSQVPFDFKLALAYFRRRAGELVDATVGDAYRRVLLTDGAPALVEARQEKDARQPGLSVTILAGNTGALPSAVTALRRSFGLDDDLSAFRESVTSDAVLIGLLDRYSGLRLVRTQSAFEALVWAVVGQQINLTFAFRLKSMLVRTYGISLDYGGRTYWAFPRPEDLAPADTESLGSTGLGRRKAATIVGIAGQVMSGELDLPGLRALPRAQAEARLTALPGVGPWTAHYTMLRGLGDFGAFPAGDLVLRVAAGKLFEGGGTATPQTMKVLAERWGEWRGYAAFYLWNALAERAA